MKFSISLFLILINVSMMLAQTNEGLVDLNGTQLYVKTTGHGEPIVVIHGGPGMNHTYFLPYLNKLSKKFQITYYDQRASGKSIIPDHNTITLQSFAEDIDALRNYLGHDQIYLLAHSWGALPALQYGLAFPDKLKGIIFCNPIPFSKAYDEEMKAIQQSKLIGSDSTDRSIIIGSPNFKAGKASAYKKLLLLSFRNSFKKKSHFSALDFEIPANYKEASQALYTGLGDELGSYDYYEEVKKFSFPALILHGNADAVPLSASQQASESISHASLEVFRKSGHFIFIEEPRRFNTVVSKFIGR